MTERIYNFSAGPATMPVEVLQRAQEELLSLPGVGMSVMEISHRSKVYDQIHNNALNGIRELLNLPASYEVLFLQGGASLQFSMLPINFLPKNASADYIVTGAWGQKAVKEALRCGAANEIYSDEQNGFKTVPAQQELRFSETARYVHYTSNETIEGVEFKYDLEAGRIPVVCDASSNILSKPIDVSKYQLIYAGAQKNLGPSGVTVVIVHQDFLAQAAENQHTMLSYKVHAKNNSLANTPNTWGIYLISLVCEWLKDKGGLAAMQREKEAKAKILYDALGSSDFYRPHAAKNARSTMNVTFRLPSEELENHFCAEASKIGLDGLKGHRTVGGVRASIYNAFPRSGVEKLVEFMREFERKSG